MKNATVVAWMVLGAAAFAGCEKKEETEPAAAAEAADANAAAAAENAEAAKVNAEDNAVKQAEAEATAKAAAAKAEHESALADVQSKLDALAAKVEALKAKVAPPATHVKAPFKTKVLTVVSRLQGLKGEAQNLSTASEAAFADAKAKVEQGLTQLQTEVEALTAPAAKPAKHKK